MVVWIGLAGILPAAAELPILQEKQWLGYFVGFENKKFTFGITGQGKAAINVIGKKGEPLNRKLAVQVDFVIEEVLANGKTTQRYLVPETLESTQSATSKPKDVVFRGKVKGDAEFEVSMTEDRGVISLGGRLLNPGTLTKNPLRFSIRMKFPEAYPYEKEGGDKKQEKAFESKTQNDRIQLIWADGKRLKPSTTESVDAGSKEINGPGITAAQIEFSSYQENKFLVTATPNSLLSLSNSKAGPLHGGFFLNWTPDPVKDPENKARLQFEVK